MPGTRVEARPRFNIRSRPRAISQKAAEKIAPRDRRKHDERIKPALLAYCDAPAPRRVPHPGRLAVAPYHPRRCSPGAVAVSHLPPFHPPGGSQSRHTTRAGVRPARTRSRTRLAPSRRRPAAAALAHCSRLSRSVRPASSQTLAATHHGGSVRPLTAPVSQRASGIVADGRRPLPTHARGGGRAGGAVQVPELVLSPNWYCFGLLRA